MQATTIKLEGELVRQLKALKPSDETLSGFVRGLLDAALRRERMRVAAEQYAEFVRTHAEERTALDEWAMAPLERSATRRQSK